MMLSTPCSTRLYSCPRISSSCSRCARSFQPQTWLLSPKSFPSICLRRTVKSPLHPGNVSRLIMGETTQRPSQPLHKRSRTWRARMLSFLLCLQLLTLRTRYHPHLVQTLSKWSNKIQSVAPSVLLPSNRNAFTKSSRNELKNAVQLVSESFSDQTSWTKMIDRTRVYRGKGERIRSDSSQATEHDPEVFDDTDFYQQLLRDVIDTRGGGSSSHDWLQAQKERKRKKVVDTKASKGRKIRWPRLPPQFCLAAKLIAVVQVRSSRETPKLYGPHPRDQWLARRTNRRTLQLFARKRVPGW